MNRMIIMLPQRNLDNCNFTLEKMILSVVMAAVIFLVAWLVLEIMDRW